MKGTYGFAVEEEGDGGVVLGEVAGELGVGDLEGGGHREEHDACVEGAVAGEDGAGHEEARRPRHVEGGGAFEGAVVGEEGILDLDEGLLVGEDDRALGCLAGGEGGVVNAEGSLPRS